MPVLSNSRAPRLAPSAVDEQTLRSLYAPIPGAVGRAFVLTYAALAAAFGVALWSESVAGYLAGFIIAVAVQTRLAVIMHEGAHWLLHPDKRVNDRLSNWLAAFPIGTTIGTYRRNHLPHHTHLGTTDDPDFTALCLPPIEKGLLASVRDCVTGWRHVQLFFKYTAQRGEGGATDGAPVGLAGRLAWQGALLGIAATARQPWAYVLIWLVPLFTFGVLINEVRSIVEHTPLLEPTAGPQRLEPTARTVLAGWPGRTWIAPLWFHYHLEHHLFPGVPFSRLPELHKTLLAGGYYAAHPQLLWSGYLPILSVLWRCFRRPQQRPQVTIENGVYFARAA
jgi:fatty acid desaturase